MSNVSDRQHPKPHTCPPEMSHVHSSVSGQRGGTPRSNATLVRRHTQVDAGARRRGARCKWSGELRRGGDPERASLARSPLPVLDGGSVLGRARAEPGALAPPQGEWSGPECQGLPLETTSHAAACADRSLPAWSAPRVSEWCALWLAATPPWCVHTADSQSAATMPLPRALPSASSACSEPPPPPLPPPRPPPPYAGSMSQHYVYASIPAPECEYNSLSRPAHLSVDRARGSVS
eukprot:COSAG01_NODE_2122_length_8373_cov_4.387962_14_plen_235_part_00